MPVGNYSYAGSNQPRPIAITEPEDELGRSRGNIPRAQEDEQGIFAKEPDRQSTARRSSTSRRASVEEDDQTDQPRARSAQRGGGRKTAQARRATERAPAARRSAGPETKGRQKKSRRGFAAMSSEQQRDIARKGGLTVSKNRRHMADIGRVGGEHSHGGRRARR